MRRKTILLVDKLYVLRFNRFQNRFSSRTKAAYRIANLSINLLRTQIKSIEMECKLYPADA